MPTQGPSYFLPHQSHLNPEIKTALLQLCDYKPTPEYTSLREIMGITSDDNPYANDYTRLVGTASLEAFLSSNQRCKSLIAHIQKFAVYNIRDTFDLTDVEWSAGNLSTAIADGIKSMGDKWHLASEKTVKAMKKGPQAIAQAEAAFQQINYQYSRVRYWNKLLQEKILPIAGKISVAMSEVRVPELVMPQPSIHFQPTPPPL